MNKDQEISKLVEFSKKFNFKIDLNKVKQINKNKNENYINISKSARIKKQTPRDLLSINPKKYRIPSSSEEFKKYLLKKKDLSININKLNQKKIILDNQEDTMLLTLKDRDDLNDKVINNYILSQRNNTNHVFTRRNLKLLD